MIAHADMPEGYLLHAATPHNFEVRDVDDPELRVKADVEANGELWFSIRAIRQVDGSRGTVRGGILYDLMMRHFGETVGSIVGWWTEGKNYDQYWMAIRRGETSEVAAAKTWSGQQALRHGFGVASVREECDPEYRVFIKAMFKRTEDSE